MTEPERWLLSGCIIAFLLILGSLLDGPSHTEAQRAVASDLRDSQAQARRAVAAREVCDGRPFNWNGDTITCYTGSSR
jgi:hypothetical protein